MEHLRISSFYPAIDTPLNLAIHFLGRKRKPHRILCKTPQRAPRCRRHHAASDWSHSPCYSSRWIGTPLPAKREAKGSLELRCFLPAFFCLVFLGVGKKHIVRNFWLTIGKIGVAKSRSSFSSAFSSRINYNEHIVQLRLIDFMR